MLVCGSFTGLAFVLCEILLEEFVILDTDVKGGSRDKDVLFEPVGFF